MNVRQLNSDEFDLKRVIDLLVTHFVPEHKMGSLSAVNLNLEKGVQWVIYNVGQVAFGVEDEGKLVGSLGLHRTTPWYSDSEYLADGWFYVLPEYRKTGVGKMLIDAAKKFAEEAKLPLIVGVFTSEDADTKAQVMQKLGLTMVGGMFAAGV